MWKLLLLCSLATTLRCMDDSDSETPDAIADKDVPEYRTWKEDLAQGEDALRTVYTTLALAQARAHDHDGRLNLLLLSAAHSVIIPALKQHTHLMSRMARRYILSRPYAHDLSMRVTLQTSMLEEIAQLQRQLDAYQYSSLHEQYLMEIALPRAYAQLMRRYKSLHVTRAERDGYASWLQRLGQTVRCLMLPPASVTTLQSTLEGVRQLSFWVDRQACAISDRAVTIGEAVETVINPPLTPLALRWIELAFQHVPYAVRRKMIDLDPTNLEPLDHLVQQHVPVSAYVQHFQGILNILNMRRRAQSFATRLPYTLPVWMQRAQVATRTVRSIIEPTQNFIHEQLTHRPYGPAAKIILTSWQKTMRDLSEPAAETHEKSRVGLGLLLDASPPERGTLTHTNADWDAIREYLAAILLY